MDTSKNLLHSRTNLEMVPMESIIFVITWRVFQKLAPLISVYTYRKRTNLTDLRVLVLLQLMPTICHRKDLSITW
jgi:hypothetical protein